MPVPIGPPIWSSARWWHQELAVWQRQQADPLARRRRDLPVLQVELGQRAFRLLRTENRRT